MAYASQINSTYGSFSVPTVAFPEYWSWTAKSDVLLKFYDAIGKVMVNRSAYVPVSVDSGTWASQISTGADNALFSTTSAGSGFARGLAQYTWVKCELPIPERDMIANQGPGGDIPLLNAFKQRAVETARGVILTNSFGTSVTEGADVGTNWNNWFAASGTSQGLDVSTCPSTVISAATLGTSAFSLSMLDLAIGKYFDLTGHVADMIVCGTDIEMALRSKVGDKLSYTPVNGGNPKDVALPQFPQYMGANILTVPTKYISTGTIYCLSSTQTALVVTEANPTIEGPFIVGPAGRWYRLRPFGATFVFRGPGIKMTNIGVSNW